jgi:predicted acetyltransferase
MIELRYVEGEELAGYARAHSLAFNNRMTEERIARLMPVLTAHRCLAAFDGGRIVGTSIDMPLDLTVPGGKQARAVGLTWVGVVPTARRRGVLRAMVDRQLDDAREQGVPLAALFSSETTIYGRFGFGPATERMTRASIETSHGAFHRSISDDGSLEMIEEAEPLELLREVHEQARAQRPGDVSRHPADWEDLMFHIGACFKVLHRDAEGKPDGYAVYDVERRWEDEVPRHVADVRELITVTDAAHRALWRFLLDLDLVGEVRVTNRPLDEPIRWLLREHRHFMVQHVSDGMWLAPLDAATALTERGYLSDGAIRLEVAGAGRFELEAAGGDARCEPTTAPADIELPVSALGSLYLGGVSAETLLAAARLRELTPGAAARAAELFRAERAPWCSTEF